MKQRKSYYIPHRSLECPTPSHRQRRPITLRHVIVVAAGICLPALAHAIYYALR